MIRYSRNFFPLLAFMLLMAIPQIGFSQIKGQNENENTVNQPTSRTAMENRIVDDAAKFVGIGPVPRFAVCDLAYPADPIEYREMDGCGVLLVVVFSKDKSELPPKRIYLRSQGAETQLTLITGTFQAVDSKSLVAKVFGQNKWEGIYFLPVHLASQKLLIDFSTHRKGFVLNDSFEGGKGLPKAKPKGSGPSKKALVALIKREFRGFFEE